MRKPLSILVVLFSTLSFINSNAQDKVTIEISGKHDLVYDGSTLHLYAPNLSVGRGAGQSLTSSLRNTILGEEAAFKLGAGNDNTIVGFQAGANNEGSGNVFLGYQAGLQQNNISNKLYISNSDTNSPLIYGDFDTRRVTINDNLIVAGNINAWYNVVVGNDLTVLEDAILEKDLIVEGDMTVESEVSLPNYVSGSNQVLAVASNGDLINKELKETKYNKFSFIKRTDTPTTYDQSEVGVNLVNGITINGLKAVILDNDTSPNVTTENSIFVYLRRLDKYDANASSELIYAIISTNTPTDEFIDSQVTSLWTGCTGCDVIDNDNYIYYIGIIYCNDCDYREVTILE